MRFSIGSQCSFWRSGAMGDLWEDPSTILAAVFCILCILSISEDGSSLRRVLHESSLDMTREWINLLVFVSSRYPRIFPICRKADIADEQTFFTWDFIVKSRHFQGWIHIFFFFFRFYWLTDIIKILTSNQQWLENKRKTKEKKVKRNWKHLWANIILYYSEAIPSHWDKNKIIVSIIFSHWGVTLQTPHTPARRGYKNSSRQGPLYINFKIPQIFFNELNSFFYINLFGSTIFAGARVMKNIHFLGGGGTSPYKHSKLHIISAYLFAKGSQAPPPPNQPMTVFRSDI